MSPTSNHKASANAYARAVTGTYAPTTAELADRQSFFYRR
jgi:hypothetical protein